MKPLKYKTLKNNENVLDAKSNFKNQNVLQKSGLVVLCIFITLTLKNLNIILRNIFYQPPIP